MLISICDVPEERRSDVERAGGEVIRIFNGLIDAQFKDHSIRSNGDYAIFIRPNSGGAHFVALSNEYSKIIID